MGGKDVITGGGFFVIKVLYTRMLMTMKSADDIRVMVMMIGKLKLSPDPENQ